MQTCILCSNTEQGDNKKYDSQLNWAELLDGTHFKDRRFDMFEILNFDFDYVYDIDNKKHICNSCLENVEFKQYKSVQCPRCKEMFTACFREVGNTTQGDDCSSTVTDEFVIGAYGSEWDNVRVRYVNSRPDELELGWNICDNCIKELIKIGVCEDLYQTYRCPDCKIENRYYTSKIEQNEISTEIIDSKCYDCVWADFKEGKLKCTKCKKEYIDWTHREGVPESVVKEVLCYSCEWETSSEEDEEEYE